MVNIVVQQAYQQQVRIVKQDIIAQEDLVALLKIFVLLVIIILPHYSLQPPSPVSVHSLSSDMCYQSSECHRVS